MLGGLPIPLCYTLAPAIDALMSRVLITSLFKVVVMLSVQFCCYIATCSRAQIHALILTNSCYTLQYNLLESIIICVLRTDIEKLKYLCLRCSCSLWWFSSPNTTSAGRAVLVDKRHTLLNRLECAIEGETENGDEQ
jgi:hypothetical protein